MRRMLVAMVVAVMVATGFGVQVAPAGGQPASTTVVLVAGSDGPPAGDGAIVSLLSGLFTTVEVIDDDAVDLAASVLGFSPDLVMVSSSVVPTTVGSQLRDIPVPIITWEAYVADDFGFTDGRSASQGEAAPARTIQITDPSHPIAAGLSGRTFVTFRDRPISFARVSGDATVIATTAPGSNRAAIAAWDTGDALDTGTAPARRVLLFPSYDTPRVLLQAGRDILTAAVNWATAGSTTPPPNTPPDVEAGPNRSITLPADTVSLTGSVTDDGRPNPPGTLTIGWTGPSGVTFVDTTDPTTDVTFPGPGTYTLTLSGDDSTGPVTDTVTITVVPQPDLPPTVDAGDDTNLTLPSNTISLDGTVGDDNQSPVTITWSQTGGPPGVTFDNPTNPGTTATFPAAGNYELTLTATDGTNPPVADTVEITVANPPPDGDQTAIIIVGAVPPPPGDRALIQAVEDLGLNVVLVDDDNLAELDLTQGDVLLISTSVVISKVDDTFVDADIPILIWEGYLFDEMLLSSGGEASGATNIDIVDPANPIAAGNNGSTRIYTTANNVSFGRPAPGATVIAHRPGIPQHATIMAFDTGAERRDGTPSPHRRVAMYMTYFGAQRLTPAGVDMFQAAITYLLVPDNEAPVAAPDRAATDEKTPITIGPDYTTSISSPGGQITKIAADPRTGHYVAIDRVNADIRIRVYDPVNRRVLHTGTIVSGIASGVDVDHRTGSIVVADRLTSTVTVLDPTLSTVLDTETVIGLGAIASVTVDPFTGNIIVGGGGASRIYSPGFATSTDVEHDGLNAGGIDVDERNGEIVAVLFDDQGSFAPGQIQRWESDGSFLATIATADMDFPVDLSIDQSTGDIAVPSGSGPLPQVTVFDENGNTEIIIGGVSSPRGVAYDPLTGNLTVADSGGSIVDPVSGTLLDSFLDERTRTMAVQPLSEEILSNTGVDSHRRFIVLDPTTRTQLGLADRFVVDVATDPTTGRIAVIIGEASSSRQVEIYDPTGTTLLHSMAAAAGSVAFHPDTGDVGLSLRTGTFKLFDPTLTTELASFSMPSSNGIGIQPDTGNVVGFNLPWVRIVDSAGNPITTIPATFSVLDIAVDPSTGVIAVAEANTSTQLLDPTGTTVLDTVPAPVTGDGAAGVAFGGTGNLIIGYESGGSLDVMVRSLLANDSDPDGDPLTVTGFDAVSANGAAVTVNPDGSFTYDPTGVAAIEALGAGETLADTFTYTIGDGIGGTDTATTTVFVAGVNDPPVLTGSSAISIPENSLNVANFGATDDRDAEGNGLTYSLIGAVDDGQFYIDGATGVVTFTAAPDIENPADDNGDNDYELTVTVADSGALTDVQDIIITVTDVNEPPDARDDSFTIDEDDPIIANLFDDNGDGPDSDPDLGDTFTVTSSTAASKGLALVEADGSFIYVPFSDATGTDTFTYTITDLAGSTDTATVTIDVTPVNDPPVNTVPGSLATDSQTPLVIGGAAIQVVDVDAGSAIVTTTLSTTFGTLTMSPGSGATVGGDGTDAVTIDGTITQIRAALDSVTFDPAGTLGTATVTMTTDDGGATGSGGPQTDTDSFTIDVSAVPDAVDDAYDSLGNVGIDVTSAGSVLNNDLGGTPTQLTFGPAVNGTTTVANGVSTISTVNGGVVILAPDGTFTYAPAAGFTGTDSFFYGSSNDGGGDTAEVTITVRDLIWFIDGSATNPVDDGTLAQPFTTFAQYLSELRVAPGDSVFVADGSYTGGLALLDNQALIGEGADDDLATALGITVPVFSNALPATNGTDPELQFGVSVSSGNTIRGLEIDGATGDGISGAAPSSLTVDEVTINNAGVHGIDLAEPAGTITITDTTINSTDDTGIRVHRSNGPVNINITGATIDGNSAALANPGSGIAITADNFADIDVSIADSTITNIEAQAILLHVIPVTGGFPKIDADITGNMISNGGGADAFPSFPAIDLLTLGRSQVTFDITTNTIIDHPGHGIVVEGNGRAEGRIGQTGIGNNIASGLGRAINLDSEASTDWFVLIEDNQLSTSAAHGEAVKVFHRDSRGELHLTIDDNTSAGKIAVFSDEETGLGAPNSQAFIRAYGNSFLGAPNTPDTFHVDVNDTSDACVDIQNSSFFGAQGITLDQSGASFLRSPAGSASTLSTINGGVAVATNGTVTFNAACPVPTLPSN